MNLTKETVKEKVFFTRISLYLLYNKNNYYYLGTYFATQSTSFKIPLNKVLSLRAASISPSSILRDNFLSLVEEAHLDNGPSFTDKIPRDSKFEVGHS